jgi:hypothetical protein
VGAYSSIVRSAIFATSSRTFLHIGVDNSRGLFFYALLYTDRAKTVPLDHRGARTHNLRPKCEGQGPGRAGPEGKVWRPGRAGPSRTDNGEYILA